MASGENGNDMANETATTYTMETISEFCAARNTGARVEVDEELYFYFLEVLPPIHMRYTATVRGDSGPATVAADFGFAEGTELVTAFWQGRGDMKGRYFAQHTTEMARGW